MINNFDQKLIWLEREVLALKTAQERGLGTMNFYRNSVNLSYAPGSPLYITVTATAKAGEIAPFFCQLFFNTTEDLIMDQLTTSDTSVAWRFYYNSLSSQSFTFTVISTSDCTVTATQGN